VILIVARICVIAMVTVEMVYIGRIPVVVVRGGCVVVVVIAVLHIPVVPVRWMLIRRIEMAGAIVMIGVSGRVGVVRVDRVINVIVVPAVGVISERKITMRVSVIAMVAVQVAMSVDMRRGVRVVAVGP
jgi:hypothetical protein